VLIEHVLHGKGDHVWAVPPEASVADAVGELRRRGVGALVVAAQPATVDGILSERDIVRALAAEGAATLDRPVADLMTTEVLTCGPRATVDELARLMTDRRIRHVPVVADDGRLVGLVSIGDVVKSRIDELRTEAATLQDYLSSGR
jgi:CBS domain-containing protein